MARQTALEINWPLGIKVEYIRGFVFLVYIYIMFRYFKKATKILKNLPILFDIQSLTFKRIL